MKFTKTDMNKTLWVKPEELEKSRNWYKVDAQDKTLWRLATKIASLMIWKHKPEYSDAWDAGDFVVVENAEKIKVSWNKYEDKIYRFHSGYKGNMKEISLEEMLKKHPERALWYAVRGMLPKNKLRKKRMKRLKVFAGTSNKYEYLPLIIIK